MTPDEAVRAMAGRLEAVDWTRHGHRAWSKAALLKEYFRRVAKWADTFGWETREPFFDVAARIDPTVQADPGVVADVVAKVQAGGWNVQQVTPFVLRWAALAATPGFVRPAGLEDPYEPLVRLFERDGGFHTANGEVDLEYKAVRMAGWRARAADPPIADFSAATLDEIDRAGSTAQFGYVLGPDD